jgi:hypothetical protein
VKPANPKKKYGSRLRPQQNGKRKVVAIVGAAGTRFQQCSNPRAKLPPSFAPVFPRGARDEAGSWDNLHERFEVKRINHQKVYAFEGACANWAEEYFSRFRRAEVGIHHYLAGAYLLETRESRHGGITATSRTAIR